MARGVPPVQESRLTRDQRLSRLVEFVVEQGSVHVDDIVRSLGVSLATARRDLDALADQQLVTRTRGGARANNISGDLPLRYRSATRSREKGDIGRFAAALVHPGMTVCFNGGTTTTRAAQELGVRVAGDEQFAEAGLTVVTNAVNIANDLILRPEIRVVVTGGVARTRSYELVGPLSELILPEIAVDSLFLGVNAVDLEGGALFTHHDGEAAVNGALVRAARRTVVLADSSKLGRTAFARICTLAEVHEVVTDHGADPRHLAALRDHGLTVHVLDDEER